ncbi:MAG TPA: energy transducer TonB [Opitutaceae bacterium]|jgi:protein TonB
MKTNILRLSALTAALAAISVLPAGAATGTALTPVPSEGTDRNPVPLSQAKPFYSAYLRHSLIEGEVVVSITVSPHGNVADATIVSSKERLLNKPTLDAIMKWRFSPALKAGVPVSSKVREVVVYSISDAPW